VDTRDGGDFHWVTVERVWHDRDATGLVELSLDGPHHTYVTGGLGTHNCNALTPQMQKLLNGITDFRKRIEAPVAGRVFDLRPDAQLWVVGTMNFSAYGGVNALNEDLKSRFAMLPLGYPPSDDERALVTAELGELKARLTEDVINKAMRFAAETRAPEFSYALSPRDVVIWLRTIAAADLPTGLWMLMGRFEDTDIALAQTRLAAIFGNTALALYQRQIATSRRPG
jgi:MoxR-like ATPase